METTVIARRDTGEVMQPAAAAQMSFADMTKAAEVLFRSGFWQMKKAEDILALMLLCQAEGKHPAQAVREYDVIQGRPAKKAQAMQADFQAAGGRIRWIEHTDKAVEAEFSHPSGGCLPVRWTIEMAREAGLTGKQNWKSYPRQMLTARVIAEGVRAVLPGASLGIYAPEEVMDFDDPKPLPRPEPNILPAASNGGEVPRGADIEAQLKADMKSAMLDFGDAATRCGIAITSKDDARQHLTRILGKTGPFTATDYREGARQLVETAPQAPSEAPQDAAEGAEEPAQESGPAMFPHEDFPDPFGEDLPENYATTETGATGRKRGK